MSRGLTLWSVEEGIEDITGVWVIYRMLKGNDLNSVELYTHQKIGTSRVIGKPCHASTREGWLQVLNFLAERQ
jgi:hypothetical protein